MKLTDQSKALQTFSYMLEIEFASATLPVGCQSTYNVTLTAYLSAICPEIASALDSDDESLGDTIYMSYPYSEGNGTSQDRYI